MRLGKVILIYIAGYAIAGIGTLIYLGFVGFATYSDACYSSATSCSPLTSFYKLLAPVLFALIALGFQALTTRSDGWRRLPRMLFELLYIAPISILSYYTGRYIVAYQSLERANPNSTPTDTLLIYGSMAAGAIICAVIGAFLQVDSEKSEVGA